MACNSTNGIENNAGDNADMDIDVLCNSHSQCSSSQYCDSSQHCSTDVIPGYNCYGVSYTGLEDDEVCGNGTNRIIRHLIAS